MKYVIPIGIVVVVVIALALTVSFVGVPTITMPTGPPQYAPLPAVTAEFRAGEVTEFTFTSDMVTNLECSGEAVKLTLTNIEDRAWTIGNDVVFYINSYPDTTPGCDKTTLAPGESTICDGLDAVGLGYQPTVIVDTPHHTDVKKLTC